jgi:hypothetical protein
MIRTRQGVALLAAAVLVVLAAPVQTQGVLASVSAVRSQLFPSDPPVIRG